MTMKNLVLVLFVFISNIVLSQLNTDSIESIMIRLTRKDRDLKGSSFLYTSERCKKTSKIHLDYTLKYLDGKSLSHYETIPFYCKKTLTNPSDRYGLFNKDSISVEISDDYYVKSTLWGYSAEIMTALYIKNINQSDINEVIAKMFFDKFKKSPSHYNSMMENPLSNNIYRGNFSIGYKKVILNGDEYFSFYCVGVFDTSIYFNSFPVQYKRSQQSNFYLD